MKIRLNMPDPQFESLDESTSNQLPGRSDAGKEGIDDPQRKRKPTEKGLQYQRQTRERNFTSAVSQWKRTCMKAQAAIRKEEVDSFEELLEDLEVHSAAVEFNFVEVSSLLDSKTLRKLQDMKDQIARETDSLKEQLEPVESLDLLEEIESILSEGGVEKEPEETSSKEMLTPQQEEEPVITKPKVTSRIKPSPSEHSPDSGLAAIIDRLELPSTRIPSFSGDPLHFQVFMLSFDDAVDSRNLSITSKLRRLVEACTGDALAAIQPCLLMKAEDGYDEARKILKERFGDKYRVAKATVKAITDGPSLKDKDPGQILKFADKVQSCMLTLKALGRLGELETPDAMVKIMGKLPASLQARWRKRAVAYNDKHGDYPAFAEFASFIRQVAREENDPMFGIASEPKPTGQSNSKSAQPKAKTFQLDSKEQTSAEQLKHCLACNEHHALSKCATFANKTLEERKNFIKENRICFGCLIQGHMSRYCRRRSTCEVCQKRHPTLLHDYSLAAESDCSTTALEETATALAMARSDSTSCTSMIVPVWVSHTSGLDETLTYALLDTQSSVSFISEELAEATKAQGHPVKLTLSTLTSTTEIESQAIVNLNVRRYNSNATVCIKKCYTKDLPVTDPCHIPTSETARSWPHLSHLAQEIPSLQDCGVHMLIGYDCMRALEPQEVVSGDENRPYAIRTMLGWSIVGSPSDQEIKSCLRTQVKECPALRRVIDVLNTDLEDVKGSASYSQEDLHFVETMKKGLVQEEDGHQRMPLPMKGNFTFGNSRNTAEKRLQQLKKRLVPGDPEVRAQSFVTTVAQPHTAFPLNRLDKFSSWNSAILGFARLKRFAKHGPSRDPVNLKDKQETENFLIEATQRAAWPDDFAALASGQQPRTKKSKELDCFLDESGLLRVGGRMNKSPHPLEICSPVIVPKKSRLANLLVSHYHEKAHMGRNMTVNMVRSHGYCIFGLSCLASMIIGNCATCRRARRPLESQLMGNLPPERLQPSAPFVHCGMDCFGPMDSKNGRKTEKRYGLILTCLASRAVHVEMLDSLSTDAFINGLRCFIALRGTVSTLRCDQGTNFVGAKNEFLKEEEKIDPERLEIFLREKQCQFIMNAPHSSHAGGIWERQIRTLKSILKDLVHSYPGRLDDFSLRTLLYEAAFIVNSRPLTVEGINDPSGPQPISPNHVIMMKETVPLPPPGTFDRPDMYLRKRWQRVQYLAEQFWSRWKKEFLPLLNTRQKWLTRNRNLQVNDIVVIGDNDVRGRWKLAKVIEASPGEDGLVRRVRLLVGDSQLDHNGRRIRTPTVIERPVQKLVLIVEN